MADLADLVALLRGRRVVALTGAGVSTESGIPDYRGPGARPRTPIQHHDFITRAEARARYWARATVGWPRIAAARPNPGHLALAALERRGAVASVITQNVDRLHHAAGSAAVIELHGALADVRCLGCGERSSRADLQPRLVAANPAIAGHAAAMAPDGDAELPDDLVRDFHVPACAACEGVLKPDVVFFGGSVARPVVDAAMALVDGADVLLVAGSSLTVYSGFRFVRRAASRALPIAVVNLGPTRADDLATLRIAAATGVVLPAVAAALAY